MVLLSFLCVVHFICFGHEKAGQKMNEIKINYKEYWSVVSLKLLAYTH